MDSIQARLQIDRNATFSLIELNELWQRERMAEAGKERVQQLARLMMPLIEDYGEYHQRLKQALYKYHARP